MKISTRGRYGLRLLVDLVEQNNSAPIPLSTVAQRQQLSEKYLQQVALLLTRGGVLISVKGSGGGYLLQRPAEEIMLYDVLDILEGSISFQEHDSENENPIERVIRKHFYRHLDAEIAKTFTNISLRDVCTAGWYQTLT